MTNQAHSFLKRSAVGEYRIVSTGDLTTLQISEAHTTGRMWVDDDGFGWVLLEWELTTDKDRERERKYFESTGEVLPKLTLKLVLGIVYKFALQKVWRR